MRIRNWEHFQHFKDRRPPWIKLYRDILDDPDWHQLDPKDAKVLVMLWLIASEDKTQEGILPDIRKLSFRLRMTEKDVISCCNKLSHWLIQDDINLISERCHVVIPETETETETEHDHRFDEFWSAYPRREGKANAKKAWVRAKINGEFDSVMSALKAQADACRDLKYFPHAATWINGKRWEDEIGGEVSDDYGDLL